MAKLGFIRDFRLAERPGGAQEVVERLLQTPAGVDVLDCPPGQLDPDCDGYVLNNFLRYSEEELQAATAKPYALYVFGWWDDQVPLQHRWRQPLIEGARLVCFNSPVHRDRFLRLWGLEPRGRVEVLPCPMDFAESRAVAEVTDRPRDCLWYGELHPFKGPDVAMRWAAEHERHLDLYGIGQAVQSSEWVTYQGMFHPDFKARILSEHRAFLHFPRRPEPFCLAIIEAYLAGLEVIYSGRIGCLSFGETLDRVAERCEAGAERFWELAREVLG